MRHIDVLTLKEIHNALDDLNLGNYELAHKQLNDILNITYKNLSENKKLTCEWCGIL